MAEPVLRIKRKDFDDAETAFEKLIFKNAGVDPKAPMPPNIDEPLRRKAKEQKEQLDIEALERATQNPALPGGSRKNRKQNRKSRKSRQRKNKRSRRTNKK